MPEKREEMVEAAQKAPELDSNLPEAHSELTGVKALNWDWNEAEAEYRRALVLNPESVDAKSSSLLLLPRDRKGSARTYRARSRKCNAPFGGGQAGPRCEERDLNRLPTWFERVTRRLADEDSPLHRSIVGTLPSPLS